MIWRPRFKWRGRTLIALILLSAQVACVPRSSGGLAAIPTATHGPAAPTPTGGALLLPTDSPPGPASPPPVVTAPPAVALPDETGTSVSCPANTLRLTLTLPGGDPVLAVSRLGAAADWLFVVMDGGLYRAPALSVDAGAAQVEPLLVPGQVVAGRPAQELVDLAVDVERGWVYTLDKVGHVFRIEIAAGGAALTYRQQPPDGQVNQFGALTVDDSGRVILLDDSFGILWTPDGLESLEELVEADALTSSADVAFADGRFFMLHQDGSIRVSSGKTGSQVWRDAEGTRLGISLAVSRHLGIPILLRVDGERRVLTGYLPESKQTVLRHVFDFDDMGPLRDVVFTGGRLYAAADDRLYVYPGPATGQGVCPSPADDLSARRVLYGQNVTALTQGFQFPIATGRLPGFPRIYPGASRIYRMGIHHGLDIFRFDGGSGFGEGTPAYAIAGGQVLRATVVYEEMTDEEFNQLVEESNALGHTPDESLERLEGKQVILDHGGGLRTVYSHLQAIAPGVVPGAQVEAGQIIGAVGVTGTQGEGRPGTVAPHLHFEIWLGDAYLGFGVTVREAMWWYAEIFG